MTISAHWHTFLYCLAMQTVHFSGTSGVFTVVCNGADSLGREEIWMRSVGPFLRAARTVESVHEEYSAAGIGCRSATAVLRQVMRARASRHGKMTFRTSFVHHSDGTQRKRGHARRDYCKGFRRCIETHWQRSEVLLGTIQPSCRTAQYEKTPNKSIVLNQNYR